MAREELQSLQKRVYHPRALGAGIGLGALSTAHKAKTDQPDADNRETGWFRQDESETPDDLSRIIDSPGLRISRAGWVDGGEAAAGVKEAMLSRAVIKDPDDLSRVVDSQGRARLVGEGGEDAAGVQAVAAPKKPDDLSRAADAGGRPVDGGEDAAGVEEGMLSRAVKKVPNDLSRVVDTHGQRLLRAGYVDGGEDAAGIHEAVRYRAVSSKSPDDLPRVVNAGGECTAGWCRAR